MVVTRKSPSFSGLGLGLRLDMFFDTNSIQGSNLVDSVCDFESVPPDQLLGFGLKLGLGLGLKLGLGGQGQDQG